MTRKQKRLLRKAILLVLLIAVIFGVVKLVKAHRAQQAAAEEEAARADAGIITKQQDYSTLRYWNGSTTLSFTVNEEGIWVWADDTDFPLDDATITRISEVLTNLKPQQTITNSEGLETYDLDEPTATLEATAADGSVLTLTFGKNTDDGKSQYMLMNGEETPVYIVDGGLRSLMDIPIYDMCILPEVPALRTDLLSRVKIAAGEKTLLLAAKQEDGATTWRSGGKDLTGDVQVAEITADLTGLAILRCVDYAPSDAAAEICGFTAPAANVDVTYLTEGGAELTMTLTVGTLDLDGDGRYVRLNGEDPIYEMPADTLDALVAAVAPDETEAAAE